MRFDIEEYKRLPTAYHIRKEGKLGELIELSDEYEKKLLCWLSGVSYI